MTQAFQFIIKRLRISGETITSLMAMDGSVIAEVEQDLIPLFGHLTSAILIGGFDMLLKA